MQSFDEAPFKPNKKERGTSLLTDTPIAHIRSDRSVLADLDQVVGLLDPLVAPELELNRHGGASAVVECESPVLGRSLIQQRGLLVREATDVADDGQLLVAGLVRHHGLALLVDEGAAPGEVRVEHLALTEALGHAEAQRHAIVLRTREPTRPDQHHGIPTVLQGRLGLVSELTIVVGIEGHSSIDSLWTCPGLVDGQHYYPL